MKKTVTLIAWLSLSTASSVALAVGLGQATVSSYLDAPLEATVPLLESSGYAIDDIHISVADPPDFEAAGLDWTPLAASVRAQVIEQQGRRQVRLTSDQAVQEPWLDLLLAVEFPGGEQFRDITLLFDPQDYGQNQPRSQPEGQFQNVGSGDTLWSVAERIKPVEASVQQMMLALLEANPSVFPSGNIHDMRAGLRLQVPDSQSVLTRSKADAAAAIQAMNEAWGTRRDGAPEPVPLPGVPPSVAADDSAGVNEEEGASIAQAMVVTSAAIAAAQALQTPDTVAPESDQAEAISRAALAEQFRQSQETLEQVLAEREQMRAELDELRGNVASLTSSLDDALTAQTQTPLVASVGEVATSNSASNQTVTALMARYQWPLLIALSAMLIGLVVWRRTRREEAWETHSFAEPVPRPVVTPPSHPMSSPDAVYQPDTVHKPAPQFKTAPDSKIEPALSNSPWLADDEPADASKDDPLGYHKSQAAGLAMQGHQRRMGLQTAGADIDYHPPTVTPLQPAEELLTEKQTAPEAMSQSPHQAIEDGWEIEEVAFKPLGRDNGDPPKSST
ncbi:MAG: hypothetical protein EA345_12125 [Halomonas sp.]|nr:FimV/HubP family polar landmark protein [Halomonas sp.]TVP46819.1 MAG: hypothetical protein EA345_12125 [Halomonas sp.]